MTSVQAFALTLEESPPASGVQLREATKANRPLRANGGGGPELSATPITTRSSEPLDPEHPYPNVPPIFRQVETLTRDFREKRAKKHGSSAAQARRVYQTARDVVHAEVVYPSEFAKLAEVVSGELTPLEALHAAASTEKWHTSRAKGQRFRFRNLESCGARVRVAHCRMCKLDGKKPVPEGCDVSRLCIRCSLRKAKKRRARFGRARTTAIEHTSTERKRDGCTLLGGKFSEKMFTLTAPHFTLEDVEGNARSLEDDERRPKWARAGRELVRACGGDAVKMRVEAIWRAWPKFSRKLTEHWKQAHIEGVKIFRAAEWTPGHDGQGHPHFHVWLWGPFADKTMIARMWTEALLSCGVPPPRTPDGLAIVDIKAIFSFDGRMAAELMKGGQREALTLSRLQLRDRGGEDVFAYCEGWTIYEVIERASPRVIASLYEVLEGKRLSQASRGFFVAEPAAVCPHCAARGQFENRFSPNPSHPQVAKAHEREHERGPPWLAAKN